MSYRMLSALLFSLLMMTATTHADDKAAPVVLVQLFTSEGCSSCPPADAFLGEFAKTSPVDGVTVIPMSLHVDYWNNLGWRDPFSSKQFSDYQSEYQSALHNQSIYTPQMVVDGLWEFVGSDRAAAKNAIMAAARITKVHLSIQLRPTDKDAVEATITVAQKELSADQKFSILLAVTEDNLVTEVRRGENAGKKLQHSGVTRSLERVAEISATAGDGGISKTIKLDPSWNKRHLHVVAFVQSQTDLKVLGVATARP